MSSKAVNDLYQLSGQGTFEKLFELSVGLNRLYSSENIFDKDIMKNLLFAVEKVDRVADSLIPEHYRQASVKLIITRGDGNCLFNATSLALCGSEKLSAELRVQTTIELVENLEFYKNHPMLTLLANEFKTKNGSPWSVASLFDAIVFSNNSCTVCVKSGFDAALKCEARRTACLASVKTARRKVVQRKWVPSQASPKKNYSTCVKKSKRNSTVEQHVQSQVARPINKWHFEQETKIHFSMPLLTRNWCEKSTSEERNRAELLCSSDCDSDPVILSMPLLSPTFYFQPADASDSDQST
ncbi:Hypothetical predicted protein, partial [Paramuricea clavata]